MPQEKEDDYVHDLTSDGDVESNPGPSSALSCVSWNCQGKSKLYEALRLGALDAYDVVCLNESNFSAEDRCDFSKLVMQRGFHCYHGGGHEGHDTRGRRFARGGLVTMVKHGWASRLLRTAWCEGQYEWLGVQMDGFVLYNIHRKPGGDEALYTLEVQQLMGDYNRAVIEPLTYRSASITWSLGSCVLCCGRQAFHHRFLRRWSMHGLRSALLKWEGMCRPLASMFRPRCRRATRWRPLHSISS